MIRNTNKLIPDQEYGMHKCTKLLNNYTSKTVSYYLFTLHIKHTTGSKKGEANLYKILQHVVSVIYRYHESA